MQITKPALVFATEFAVISCWMVFISKPVWAQTSESINAANEIQATETTSNPFAEENIPVVVVVGAIKNDTKLEPSDIERIKKEIAVAIETLPGSEAEAIVGDPKAISGTYVIKGAVTNFAGAYIIKLELRNNKSDALVGAVESYPLVGAAELLSGTKNLATNLVRSSPFYEEPEPVAKEKPKQVAENAAAFHTVTYEVAPPPPSAGSSSVPNNPSSPTGTSTDGPPRTGSRVAAHVFFWIGFDAFVGGAIYIAAGTDTEGGAVFMGVGGGFILIGLICAVTYHSKMNEWKRRNKYGMVVPSISPEYGGLDYTLRF